MADLILLNGPPASGKSTLAAAFVARRPLALNLDIDVIRSLLGASLDQPHESGIAARRLALAMAGEQLALGRDVIVPQLLVRDTLILDLTRVAADNGARFVELALIIERDAALDSFAQRSDAAVETSHRDAAALVERAGGFDALQAIHDDYDRFIGGRPTATGVQVIPGDVDATLALIDAILRTG